MNFSRTIHFNTCFLFFGKRSVFDLRVSISTFFYITVLRYQDPRSVVLCKFISRWKTAGDSGISMKYATQHLSDRTCSQKGSVLLSKFLFQGLLFILTLQRASWAFTLESWVAANELLIFNSAWSLTMKSLPPNRYLNPIYPPTARAGYDTRSILSGV